MPGPHSRRPSVWPARLARAMFVLTLAVLLTIDPLQLIDPRNDETGPAGHSAKECQAGPDLLLEHLLESVLQAR